jgi:SAM-dependent methyltransferase
VCTDNDLMFEGQTQAAIDHYHRAGATATAFLSSAIQVSGWRDESIGYCLDFGCGHGRVLRVLTQTFPRATFTARDLDREAVRFCTSEFGATPVRSDLDIRRVSLGTYDLTWMGSVLTHVDAESGQELLGTLVAHLNPNGGLAFSTHGTYARDHLSAFGAVSATVWSDIERSLDDSGVAYVPYAHYASDDYGLAWHTESFVRSMIDAVSAPRLILSSFEPGGWETQDLWAATRPE